MSLRYGSIYICILSSQFALLKVFWFTFHNLFCNSIKNELKWFWIVISISSILNYSLFESYVVIYRTTLWLHRNFVKTWGLVHYSTLASSQNYLSAENQWSFNTIDQIKWLKWQVYITIPKFYLQHFCINDNVETWRRIFKGWAKRDVYQYKIMRKYAMI